MMTSTVTAKSIGLPELIGSSRQVAWANCLRDKTLRYVDSQGWYGTHQGFVENVKKLPIEATWWIENRSQNSGEASTHEAARQFLKLEYKVSAWCDY